MAAEERTWFIGSSTVRVGRFTYGDELLRIRQWGEGAALTIGSFCSIADGITVYLGGNHRVDWATTFPFGHIYGEFLPVSNIVGHPSTHGDVMIGHDVWVGSGASIMSGVTIGNGAVIAAHANVVSAVPDYAIVGGNPARILRHRFEPEIRDALLDLAWWNLPASVIAQIAARLSAPPDLASLRFLRAYIDDLRQPN